MGPTSNIWYNMSFAIISGLAEAVSATHFATLLDCTGIEVIQGKRLKYWRLEVTEVFPSSHEEDLEGVL